jgi:hypothetical protein
MKQVYKTEDLDGTPSQDTYVRGGVLFVGFLVWLMAVTNSFGQGNEINNNKSDSPSQSAATISISAPGAACQGTQAVLVQ